MAYRGGWGARSYERGVVLWSLILHSGSSGIPKVPRPPGVGALGGGSDATLCRFFEDHGFLFM